MSCDVVFRQDRFENRFHLCVWNFLLQRRRGNHSFVVVLAVLVNLTNALRYPKRFGRELTHFITTSRGRLETVCFFSSQYLQFLLHHLTSCDMTIV